MSLIALHQAFYEQDQRIQELEAMLEETMKILSIYLNVPEFRDLQERWAKLKSQP